LQTGLRGSIAESCTNIHRKEFPIPWLEALFLPEFPSRSAITEENFLISNEIGYGSFGRVYRAIAKNDSRGIYALKIQQKSLILGKAAVQQVRQEVAVQVSLCLNSLRSSSRRGLSKYCTSFRICALYFYNIKIP
ncbi:hypothetical protein COOONC_21270, partial [Cooperia oncophora]